MQGWIQRDLAVDLFAKIGPRLRSREGPRPHRRLHAGRTEGRRPSPPTSACRSTSLLSHNILAQIPGAKRPKESVMFAAHWDAYGIGPADAAGDTVRHGAADDAIGVAGVIEIARALAAGPQARPHRRLRRLDRRGARPAGQRVLRRPSGPAAGHDGRQLHHGRAADRRPQPRRGAGGRGPEPARTGARRRRPPNRAAPSRPTPIPSARSSTAPTTSASPSAACRPCC